MPARGRGRVAELEVGDLISYYAIARDNRSAGTTRVVTSDIYFLSVRPFERAYRQAEQQGGGGGGGRPDVSDGPSAVAGWQSDGHDNIHRSGEGTTTPAGHTHAPPALAFVSDDNYPEALSGGFL